MIIHERILKGSRLKRNLLGDTRTAKKKTCISPRKSNTPVFFKSLYSSTSHIKKLHCYKKCKHKTIFHPQTFKCIKNSDVSSCPVLSDYIQPKWQPMTTSKYESLFFSPLKIRLSIFRESTRTLAFAWLLNRLKLFKLPWDHFWPRAKTWKVNANQCACLK